MNFIGIDLGTTNSVACTINHGRFEYLKFGGGELLPSAILYSDGKVTVGNAARRKSKVKAENYISSAKTYMGDASKTWEIDGRTFTPTDVATEILKEIYKVARAYFGNSEEIQAVITTPAYFSGDQNALTKDAGEAAGFKVRQILAEPVAAALAYAFEGSGSKEKIYVVDLGGGTFDVSLLESDGGKSYKTLMKDGDRRLGGDNFDEAVAEIMMRELRKTIGVNLSSLESSGLSEKDYAKTRQKLMTEAEKIKCSLSNSEAEQVNIVNLLPYRDGFYDLHMTITRDDFLREATPLIRRIENTISNSFDELSFDQSAVDKIILVGGSANMPFIREYVKKFFNQEPYADKDLSKLVAIGAALKADSERGDTITLHDIIAHSLGIEITGNRFSKILEKNREYPCSNTKMFHTVYDYQEAVDILVYEGEDTEDVTKNQYIGGFTLDGIKIARTPVQINVTFEFDESCILHTTAEDPETGARRQIQLDRTKPQENPNKKKQIIYDVVVLLDNSGSMSGSMEVAKDACRRLVCDLIDTKIHRVAFITFESTASLRCHLTHDENTLLSAISSVYVGGGTDMTGGLVLAQQEFRNCQEKPLAIIVTDGYPNDKYTASARASELKNVGVKIAAIGAGSVDHNYLASLASSPSDYYSIQNMSELAAAFENIINGLKI